MHPGKTVLPAFGAGAVGPTTRQGQARVDQTTGARGRERPSYSDLPAPFHLTCDNCGRTFGTALTPVKVQGLTFRVVCDPCAQSMAKRDGKPPASLEDWNRALRRSVPRPT